MCMCVYTYMCVCVCCCLVANSCQTLVTPWDVACQALLSMGFPRQEYKNIAVSCHFLLQGIFRIFLTLGLNLSPALTGGFFTTEPPGKALSPTPINIHTHTHTHTHTPTHIHTHQEPLDESARGE